MAIGGGWGGFLAAAAGPIAKKVLTALGIGTITIVGLQSAMNVGLDAIRTAAGGMTGVTADLIAMAGFFSALSIIAGGMSAAVSMIVLSKMARVT